jgi:hypothetical protein
VIGVAPRVTCKRGVGRCPARVEQSSRRVSYFRDSCVYSLIRLNVRLLTIGPILICKYFHNPSIETFWMTAIEQENSIMVRLLISSKIPPSLISLTFGIRSEEKIQEDQRVDSAVRGNRDGKDNWSERSYGSGLESKLQGK